MSIDDGSAASADGAGAADASDAGLRAGYDAGAAAVPAVARGLVHVLGLCGALRLAPHVLTRIPGIAAAAGGPGCVSLRWALDAPERRRCLERQGELLALGARFGDRSCVLEETSCVARGDALCECRLHTTGGPRWVLVAVAAAVASVAGGIVGQGSVSLLTTGAVAAAVTSGVERWRAERATRVWRAAASRAFRRLVDGVRATEPLAGATVASVEEASAPVGAGAAPAAGPGETPQLEQEGDVWRVTYQGTTIRMRHSRGVALLNQLLLHPGQELHVQALDAVVPSAQAAGDRMPVGAAALPPDGMSLGLGDAGPALDDHALQDYRRRLVELRGELDDAERCNDPGRATSARAEMEQLGDELRAATGLHGRVRRASSDVDRMRIAVTRRIRAAIEQLGKLHPVLGAHLERSVHTGFTCCYLPVDDIRSH